MSHSVREYISFLLQIKKYKCDIFLQVFVSGTYISCNKINKWTFDNACYLIKAKQIHPVLYHNCSVAQ